MQDQQQPATPKYQYNHAYQTKVLALLVRYPNFVHRYGDVVKPEYFEYEEMSAVCRFIMEFFNRYGIQPAYDSLVAWVMDWCTKYHVSEQSKTGYLNLIYALYSLDLSDGDVVRDSALDFARRQALKIAVLSITDLIEKHGGYEKAQGILQKALSTGQGLGTHGTEVYTTFQSLPGLLAADSPYALARKLPTPFPSLNQARMGGVGPGEAMVIVGSSGQGKSIIKNCCLHTATHFSPGQWGAHVTLELKEVDIHLRYAARILGLTQEDVIRNTAEFQQRALNVPKDSRLYVKWFPPGQTTVQTVRSWISAVSADLGVGPCALVVDYPDLMIPSKGNGSSLYVDFGNIYSELITLLNDYNMPGFFSSQIDRHHQYSNEARGSHMANSIAKFYHADVVGTINQSEVDKQRGVARIFWDKCRRGRDMFFTYFRIDYPRATIIEDAEVANEIARGQAGFAQGNGQQMPVPTGSPLPN